MSSLRCRMFSPGDEAEYETMLGRDGGNWMYSAPAFLSFLRTVTGARVETCLAARGDEIVGAVSWAVADAPGVGTVLNSLPWWGSHGGVALDRSAPDSDGVRRVLIEALRDAIDRLRPLSWTVILTPAEEAHRDTYVRTLEPTATDSRIGQVTLLAPTDNLPGLFSKKTRNLVRKGLLQGFEEVVTDETWAWRFLHDTHQENIAALGGRAKPWAHFEAMRACLPGVRLSVARDAGGPAAALLTARYNRTVEYLTPGVQVAQRARQPLSFLIHAAMRAAMADGAVAWNWGGTWRSQSSLHHFKAGFGAQERPYSYLIGSSPDGIAVFRKRRAELSALFPWFYTYPYNALDDSA